jgi:DUF1365 family protein
MALSNGLLVSDVVHVRHVPKRHAFRYTVYYLCFPLSRMAELEAARPLSVNRTGLFSFYEKDHGLGQAAPAEAWIRRRMDEWGLTAADGEVVLLTMPRVMGYVFNPVSFWFCLDKAGQLRAVYAEVNNTFGEQHGYWCFHDDQRPITRDDVLTTRKQFHVSPFFEVTGEYRFRFAYGEEKLGVWIDHDAHGQHVLSTALTGKRQPLTTANLLYCFARYPLVTLKVIMLIHYHALRLVMKGIRYRTKPNPPLQEVSR